MRVKNSLVVNYSSDVRTRMSLVLSYAQWYANAVKHYIFRLTLVTINTARCDVLFFTTNVFKY